MAGLVGRLLHGRVWVALVGVLLVGIVFLNVTLLELNEGITDMSERATALKRQNADLRLRVARLGSSERIQSAAADEGFWLPPPGEVRYLRANPEGDARLAARRIEPPAASAVAPAAKPAGQERGAADEPLVTAGAQPEAPAPPSGDAGVAAPDPPATAAASPAPPDGQG